MGFGIGILRTLIRPLSRTLISRSSTTTPFSSTFTSPKSILHREAPFPWFPISNHLHSLTDTRFPKRRPMDKPRRKRATTKPPGSCSSFHFHFFVLFLFPLQPKENWILVLVLVLQGRMLGFSTHQGSPYFPIDPTKEVSKEGMRKNVWGSVVLLYWCVFFVIVNTLLNYLFPKWVLFFISCFNWF